MSPHLSPTDRDCPAGALGGPSQVLHMYSTLLFASLILPTLTRTAAAADQSDPTLAMSREADEDADDSDDSEDEDASDPLDDIDTPKQPKSPRTGTSISATLPIGVGVGAYGAGVAYGIAGTVGGGTISAPLYLVIAQKGERGGVFETGLRVNAPQVFYAEVLAGWVKADPAYGAQLGIGGGVGFDIPVYQHFTMTIGGTVSYAFAQRSVFGLAYTGPTIHI